ncbi:hypothetical protein COCNU_scaffold089132G000010 [Cocos nucifera]|nr:hypothetical protein [Cocos nucifera]
MHVIIPFTVHYKEHRIFVAFGGFRLYLLHKSMIDLSRHRLLDCVPQRFQSIHSFICLH